MMHPHPPAGPALATAAADATAPAGPGPAPASPGGDAAADGVLCPLCDYDLRGLIEPRCPECGYRFAWPELLDPELRAHPNLFEHHPRRNVWSFCRTMLGGLRPARFWRSLRPTQPSRPGRLVVYWVLCAAMSLSAVVFDAGRSFYGAARKNEENRATMLQAYTPRFARYPQPQRAAVQAQFQANIDAWYPPTFSRVFVRKWYEGYEGGDARWLPLLYVAWPWATLAALMVFAASMRAARVRPVHVLRCALYCCDAGIWLVPLAAFIAPHLAAWLVPQGYAALLTSRNSAAVGLVLIAGYTGYRLSNAYALYLRFDRPAATALAAQTIVLLLALVLLVAVPVV